MKKIFSIFCGFFCFITQAYSANIPNGFVYLKDVDPTILQDMRYATNYNFIGSRIPGYQYPACILTRPAALALSKVQKELQASSLSLKVYDCYRPQQAVDAFTAWREQPNLQKMKAEFYPRVNKADFFKLGYVAEKSGHSRGSTMDLTIIPTYMADKKLNFNKSKLIPCFAPYLVRFQDGSIDMGTNFDCMDVLSHNDNTSINTVAISNRMLLKTLMQKYGFTPYQEEWWHFTLENEPYPDTYFNFPILRNS